GAQHGLGPLPCRLAARRPAVPERLDLLERRARLQRRRLRPEGGTPAQMEADFLAGGDGEIADRAHILATQLYRRIEQQPIGTDDELQPPVLAPRHPRNGRAVIEADDQLGAHRDAAADAAHEADEIGDAVAARHEIAERDASLLRLEDRLEDEGRATVMTPRARLAVGRRDDPAPVLCRTKQGGEACRAVEA